MSMSGTIARYNITRHERPCMQRSRAHPRSGLHDLAWQQTGGVTGRTSRRPRARMPELGMLLWRSPLGTIGLCIRTNLRIRQRWTRDSSAAIKAARQAFRQGLYSWLALPRHLGRLRGVVSAPMPTQDEDSCYCSDQWLACEPGQATAGSTTWHLSSACAWQEHSVGKEKTLLERAVRGEIQRVPPLEPAPGMDALLLLL